MIEFWDKLTEGEKFKNRRWEDERGPNVQGICLSKEWGW